MGRHQHRFFYFFLIEDTIYVVHAVTKKRHRTRDADIEVAQARVAELRAQYAAGKL